MTFRVNNLPMKKSRIVRSFKGLNPVSLSNEITLRRGLTPEVCADKLGVTVERLGDLGVIRDQIYVPTLLRELRKGIPEEMRLKEGEKRTAVNIAGAILWRLGEEAEVLRLDINNAAPVLRALCESEKYDEMIEYVKDYIGLKFRDDSILDVDSVKKDLGMLLRAVRGSDEDEIDIPKFFEFYQRCEEAFKQDARFDGIFPFADPQ